jgi:uncharacterized repeat protein (TIGR03803 family)
MLRHIVWLTLLTNIMIFSDATAAQTFNVIYSFKGSPDGALPYAALFRDGQGNLYGTTTMGGTGPCFNGSVHGCGTVFKVDTNAVETILHSFQGGDDGQNPYGPVVVDLAGNIYGATVSGGLYGAGIVFKLDPAGNLTVLHNFAGAPDGANPYGGLILDAVGNLYGVTNLGGSSACVNAGGCGTVFKIDSLGVETVLYRFRSGTDGQNPYGNLWRDATGNLFGTTYRGGTGCGSGGGCGTVFRIDSHGNETVLYSFRGGADGSGPEAGVVGDNLGNLYGTTAIGGFDNCPGGCGTVFKIDTSGDESILYRFTGKRDGYLPNVALIRDSNGNLFGTTPRGGLGAGNVYSVTSSGTFKSIYTFRSGSSYGSVIEDSAGNLYGTTNGGGNGACFDGCGTVFEISRN